MLHLTILPLAWLYYVSGHVKDKAGFVMTTQTSTGSANSCALAATPIYEGNKEDRKACAEWCISQAECSGFNWQETSGVCQLLDDPDQDKLVTRAGMLTIILLLNVYVDYVSY